MKQNRINVIFAEGSANRDTNMYYLLNGANIFAHYVKKAGKPACVVHVPIEREEACKTGLRLINVNRYDRRQILEKYRDPYVANAHFITMLLDDLKVQGRVAFYGNFPLGGGYNYLRQLLKANKQIRVHNETDRSIISQARTTKDRDEVARIRKVRNAVIRAFNTMLKSARNCRVKDGYLITDGKSRLLIGDLRQVIRRELCAQNTIDSDGMIVSQGRDAGIPHNSGQDRQPVKLGQPIVFDIYPQEIGGGYFFDFTRTICFGYASEPVQKLYNTVARVHDYACSLLRVGKATRDIEHQVCKLFEKEGHRTFLTDSKTQAGYCHTLGHGIGLNVHEGPFFNLLRTNRDRLRPGMVFTIEPGLYYPEKGYGVRIEDVIYVDTRGRIVNLTRYPRRLVIPI
jgi:Xaa-Pro aminopeptidase